MTQLTKPRILIMLIFVIFGIYIMVTDTGKSEYVALGLASDIHNHIYCTAFDNFTNTHYLYKYSDQGRRLWTVAYKNKRPLDYYRRNMNNNLIVDQNGESLTYLVRENGVLLLKYSANGSLLWKKYLSGVRSVVKMIFNADRYVNIYAVTKEPQLVLVKLNPDGKNLSYETLYPINNITQVNVDNQSNLILSEYSYGNRQILLKKIGSDGRLLWSGQENASTVIGIDRENNIYLDNSLNRSIIKLSASGDSAWTLKLEQKTSPGSNVYYEPRQLMDFGSDGLILAGDKQLLDHNAYIPDANSTFVCKLDNSGGLKWVKPYKTGEHAYVFGGISSQKQDGIYVTGVYKFLDSNKNFFLAKYDADGVLKWMKKDLRFTETMVFALILIFSLLVLLVERAEDWPRMVILFVVLLAFDVSLMFN